MAQINDATSSGDPIANPEEVNKEAAEAADRAAARRATRPKVVLRQKMHPPEMLALVGAFGIVTLLLVTTINPIINPVFPLAALVFFLYPFRRVVVPRRTMQLGIIIFLVWLAFNLSGALFPFIIAFILAYLCAPLLTFLAARGIPRWITALGIVLTILGGYALIGIFLIPSLIDQFDQLVASAQDIFKGANSFFDRNALIERLTSYGIPRKQAQEAIINYVEPQLKAVLEWLFTNAASFLKNISSILEGAMTLVLIPILFFYMLLDFDRIRIFIRSTLLQDDPDYVYLIKQVDGILSSYLRGVLLTSSLVAGMAIAILSAFGVPYAVVIGIMTGVLNLIPTVGMFLNLGVAMVIYIFAPGDFWTHMLITTGTIVGLHALNSYLIEPRIIGDRVGLHPVLLIASLFVFSHFLGFIGLLVAVPSTAVILFFLKEWYRRTITRRSSVTTTPHSTPESEALGEA